VLRSALDADDAVDEVTSAGDVDRASRRPTWCRSRFRKLATSPQGPVFVGDAVWTCRPAGGPAFRASVC